MTESSDERIASANKSRSYHRIFIPFGVIWIEAKLYLPPISSWWTAFGEVFDTSNIIMFSQQSLQAQNYCNVQPKRLRDKILTEQYIKTIERKTTNKRDRCETNKEHPIAVTNKQTDMAKHKLHLHNQEPGFYTVGGYANDTYQNLK